MVVHAFNSNTRSGLQELVPGLTQLERTREKPCHKNKQTNKQKNKVLHKSIDAYIDGRIDGQIDRQTNPHPIFCLLKEPGSLTGVRQKRRQCMCVISSKPICDI